MNIEREETDEPPTAALEATERAVREDHIRRQAETLVNRWRAVSHGIEEEAVLEAGLAATVSFLRAYHRHGDRELVMRSIARLAHALRPLTDAPGGEPAEGADSGG